MCTGKKNNIKKIQKKSQDHGNIKIKKYDDIPDLQLQKSDSFKIPKKNQNKGLKIESQESNSDSQRSKRKSQQQIQEKRVSKRNSKDKIKQNDKKSSKNDTDSQKHKQINQSKRVSRSNSNSSINELQQLAQKLGKSKSVTKTKSMEAMEELLNETSIKRQKSKKDCISISFGKRLYKFDLDDKFVKEDKQLYSILNEIQINQKQIITNINENQKLKIPEIKKITDHYNFTALEYFLYRAHENIDRKHNKVQKMADEEKCCICQFELYDDIDNYGNNLDKFNLQLLHKLPDEEEQDLIIGLDQCEGHYFHKECLKRCVEEQHIKCPVCSRIYGIMTGDQPKGTMQSRVEKFSCAGYEKYNTIVINYNFPNGKRNGKNYSGTGRTVYIPDCPEGKVVFKLLQIAFERKLLFTVGRSVTTGQDNTTVWNGVHQKTNTHGGSTSFGYPDPTYFDRVKLELAMKGVTEADLK